MNSLYANIVIFILYMVTYIYLHEYIHIIFLRKYNVKYRLQINWIIIKLNISDEFDNITKKQKIITIVSPCFVCSLLTLIPLNYYLSTDNSFAVIYQVLLTVGFIDILVGYDGVMLYKSIRNK